MKGMQTVINHLVYHIWNKGKQKVNILSLAVRQRELGASTFTAADMNSNGADIDPYYNFIPCSEYCGV